ncbi:hypothetical protein F4802DRAFT_559221 [Xylaria palmicola]|nr:hypothetical protein F4802DRAFT_559221 [Xylaria palmicola]
MTKITNGRWKRGLLQPCRRWLGDVAADLRKTSVWRAMLKNVLSTTIILTISVIPAVVKVYGTSTYLGAMTSIFGQPGQRFGKMIETLSLIGLGTLFGLGWGNLGLYLSGLAYHNNIHAAWAIRAIFFVLVVIIHGMLRSSAPRLFQLVLFFMLVNLSVLTNSARAVTLSAFKAVIYPIFTALGVAILVNIAVFPQFSGGFLGSSTIETLSQTIDSFQAASEWFMTQAGDGDEENTSPKAMRTRLALLSNKKPWLRARLGSCKAVQAECNFELVFSVLPPRSLKPISVTMMTRLVHVTTSLINACESKLALAAYDEMECVSGESQDEKANDSQFDSDSSSDEWVPDQRRTLDLIKPIREIESGDIDILEHIMSRIRPPTKVMQAQIQDVVHLITTVLAYCYDVPRLPSGSLKPDGIPLQEMDIRIEIFTKALAEFDADSASALESAAAAAFSRDSMGDNTPHMETHLVSSFLIGINQAARQILEMLRHTRILVERRQTRNERRKLYWPHISWKKWLISGGEQDGNVLPENARKEARTGYGPVEDSKHSDEEGVTNSTEALIQPKTDEETGAVGSKEEIPPHDEKGSHRKIPQASTNKNIFWIRGMAADTVEFFTDSDDLAFALKMTIAALLVTWPAFVPSLNPWYGSVRGTWATLQLILVFEVSIGTTFLGFFLRAFGTVFGCSVGIIAWEVGQGNRVALVVILTLGLVPASYVQVATQYVKAGVISMVSLSVVGLATAVQLNTDAPWQIYVKRLVCFLVGGVVALAVEMIVFPVRARDRLVESLVSSISQISIMESSVAVGVDSPNVIDTKAQALNTNFHSAKEKAEQALDAARTFLPFCLTEPRIKGSFKGQAIVYGEMIFVLFQIIERMDNMLHIRKLFGSTVLEELHEDILSYRRNVAGCVTLTLFVVQEALTTRLPLPQFLPSSRVAQLRTVARVRELLLAHELEVPGKSVPTLQEGPSSTVTDENTPGLVTRQAFLAWRASSAGMMEIIEFLEELVDLAKLLVGVNAFQSGLLERPIFQDFSAKLRAINSDDDGASSAKSTGSDKAKSPQESEGRWKPRLGSFGRRPSAASATRAPLDGGMRRRQTAGSATAAAATGDPTPASEHAAEECEISWSLQRVMTKRMEESQARRRASEGAKGKYALRNVQTWTG